MDRRSTVGYCVLTKIRPPRPRRMPTRRDGLNKPLPADTEFLGPEVDFGIVAETDQLRIVRRAPCRVVAHGSLQSACYIRNNGGLRSVPSLFCTIAYQRADK